MPKFNEIEAKKEMDEIRNSKRKPRKELNAVNVRAEVKKIISKMTINQQTIDLVRHLGKKYGDS